MRVVRNRWHRVFAGGLLAFTAMLSALVQAQGSGAALSGKVLDPEAKVVVNAAVIVRNEATNEVKAVVTDSNGHFSITGLTTGAYTVEVAVPGFEIVRRSGVQATITGGGEDLVINLSVANISETVTVSTALPGAAV